MAFIVCLFPRGKGDPKNCVDLLVHCRARRKSSCGLLAGQGKADRVFIGTEEEYLEKRLYLN